MYQHEKHDKSAPPLCPYQSPIMHWELGIGLGVWTFNTGLISVQGPRSKRSKTPIVVRFGENRGEIFGSPEQHSGVCEWVRDLENIWREERKQEKGLKSDKIDRTRKDRRQSNKSSGFLNPCSQHVHTLCVCTRTSPLHSSHSMSECASRQFKKQNHHETIF